MQRDFTADGGPANEDISNACTAGQDTTTTNSWHGTAVASVLAGTQIGVAKTQVVSLKVHRCITSLESQVADIIEATDWIASTDNPHRLKPGVINFSGFIAEWRDDQGNPAGDDRSAFGDAVDRLVTNTNMPFFTSADNFSADACRFSPNDRARTYHRSGNAFVVGGTSQGTANSDPSDYRMQFYQPNGGPARLGNGSGSNAGGCVSIYAPSTSIYVAYNSSATFPEDPANPSGPRIHLDYGRESGTSFASPLVAGIAARYIQKQSVRPGAQDVYTFLLNNAVGSILNSTTQAYYLCAAGINPQRTYLPGSQPPSCPFGTIGQSGSGSAPMYFPAVGNSSNARNVYFDEGYCP